jgi:hypothetical protein
MADIGSGLPIHREYFILESRIMSSAGDRTVMWRLTSKTPGIEGLLS